eukprot:g40477.t1
MQKLLLLQTMEIDIMEDLQEVKIFHPGSVLWSRIRCARVYSSRRMASKSFLSSVMEVLDDSTQARLDQPQSLDELTEALESFEKNKTPGSDRLLAELYSALWDLIDQDLLELYDSMLLAVCRVMSICDQFELASGAKVNRGKSETMFFRNWVGQSLIPFTIRSDCLKVLGIWFRGAGACATIWEEHVTKARQKLGKWEHGSLSIVDKTLVIR